MSLFKRRRFPVEIILLCVRWDCKYDISWREDETELTDTVVRVGGQRKYLLGAIDKPGELTAFLLSDHRDARAAYRFLRKAVRTMSDYPPSSITIDKLASYTSPKAPFLTM